MQITQAQHEEIKEHLLYGKKVNAIKAMRAFTGSGLKDAKTEIDVFVDAGHYVDVVVINAKPWWQFW